MEACSLVQLTNAEEVREVLSELFSVGQGAVGLNQHQALFVKIKSLVRKHIRLWLGTVIMSPEDCFKQCVQR